MVGLFPLVESPRPDMPRSRSASVSGLPAVLLAAATLGSCSSGIDLQPLDTMSEESPRGSAPDDDTAISEPAADGTPPAGQGGTPPSGGEQLPSPTLIAPGGSGSGGAGSGRSGNGASGSGASGSAGGSVSPEGGAMGGASGAPACPDADADGRCDAVDLCPNVPDDGTDRDADGIPDVCDPCGIGVALGLSPVFYFPLDETSASAAAFNLGSVRQNGVYVGAVERGLAGVSDPAGRAARFTGESNGEFSRVVLTDVPAFPSTALTAMFWVRTKQSGDYVVISYAIEGSANEFAIIVERDRLIVTLESSTFQDLNLDRNLITDGTWHFVALTWNQTRAQFYFDGQAVGSPLITEPGFEIAESVSVPISRPLSLSPGGVLVLGQDQDSVDGDYSVEQALIGGLDEVAIYDRVLSPEQIRDIFTATTCGERCDGLDNDGDGKVDEGFLGSAAACAAPSCDAIAVSSAFGSGDYFSSVTLDAPLTCSF